MNDAAAVPAPARFRELAQAARALAAEINGAHHDLRSSDVEFIKQAGFRLDDAAGTAKDIGHELEETARDLDRYLSRPVGVCEIPWGVCPGHGNTLTSTGGRTTCAKCRRTWDYDRIAMPCEERARWLLADKQGATSPGVRRARNRCPRPARPRQAHHDQQRQGRNLMIRADIAWDAVPANRTWPPGERFLIATAAGAWNGRRIMIDISCVAYLDDAFFDTRMDIIRARTDGRVPGYPGSERPGGDHR